MDVRRDQAEDQNVDPQTVREARLKALGLISAPEMSPAGASASTTEMQENATLTSVAEANATPTSVAEANATPTSVAEANASPATVAQANATPATVTQANATPATEVQANAIPTTDVLADVTQTQSALLPTGIQTLMSSFLGFGQSQRPMMPIVFVINSPTAASPTISPTAASPTISPTAASSTAASAGVSPTVVSRTTVADDTTVPSISPPVVASTSPSSWEVTVQPSSQAAPIPMSPAAEEPVSIDLYTPPASPPDWLRTFARSPTPEFLRLDNSAPRSTTQNWQLNRRSSPVPSTSRARSRSFSPARSRSRSPLRTSPPRHGRHRSPVAGTSRGSHYSPRPGPSRERSLSPIESRSRSSRVTSPARHGRERSPVAGSSRGSHHSPKPGPSRERSVSPMQCGRAKPAPKKRGRPKGSKNKTPESVDKPRCSVCLDEKGPFVSTSCGHLCHEKCLKRWMRTKGEEHNFRKTCPFCGKMYTQYFNLYY